MTDDVEDFEVEALESAGLEAELFPEDRERLEGALSGTLEILSAPAEACPDSVLRVLETLEELHPYFPDARLSDGLGEVMELLHEVSESRVLDFEEAQAGKRAVETMAETLGIEVGDHEI